jgi:hypothetical protein
MPKYIGGLKMNIFKTPKMNSQFGRWEYYIDYNFWDKKSKGKTLFKSRILYIIKKISKHKY